VDKFLLILASLTLLCRFSTKIGDVCHHLADCAAVNHFQFLTTIAVVVASLSNFEFGKRRHSAAVVICGK
jgi:hypothetical protein